MEDETAAENVAEAEGEAGGENEEANKPAEPEVKSYAEFLAERDASKPSDLGVKAPRRALDENANAKWANAKPLPGRDQDEYFSGKQEEKGPRQRAQNKKTFLDVDFAYQQPPVRESTRGGGRGGGRGRGAPRGGDRPSRPRGDRPPRNGQQGQGPKVDETNFPSLKAT